MPSRQRSNECLAKTGFVAGAARIFSIAIAFRKGHGTRRAPSTSSCLSAQRRKKGSRKKPVARSNPYIRQTPDASFAHAELRRLSLDGGGEASRCSKIPALRTRLAVLEVPKADGLDSDTSRTLYADEVRESAQTAHCIWVHLQRQTKKGALYGPLFANQQSLTDKCRVHLPDRG